MRLHLGCGKRYFADAINIDRFDRTVADLAADARRLPFADQVFSQIVALQLFEHLGYAGALYALSEWHRVLEPEGKLVIETPDPTGAFQRFLEARSPEAKDRALGWIFGDEAPGFSHTFLYPKDLLELMVRRAGFEVIGQGEATTYTSEPGFRLECRRVTTTTSMALSMVRSRIIESILAFEDPSEVAELENEFFEHLRCSVEKHFDAPDSQLEAAMVIWSRATWLFVDELDKHGTKFPQSRSLWSSMAEKLARFNLSGRLTAMIAPSTDQGSLYVHLHEELTNKGIQIVRKLRASKLTVEQCWKAVFDSTPPEPLGEVFTASRIQHFAETLHARAIKFWLMGDLKTAQKNLEKVCRTGTGQLYASWNLGRLAALEGDLDRALRFLNAALPFSDDRESGPLLDDIDICLLAQHRKPQRLTEFGPIALGELSQ